MNLNRKLASQLFWPGGHIVVVVYRNPATDGSPQRINIMLKPFLSHFLSLDESSVIIGPTLREHLYTHETFTVDQILRD